MLSGKFRSSNRICRTEQLKEPEEFAARLLVAPTSFCLIAGPYVGIEVKRRKQTQQTPEVVSAGVRGGRRAICASMEGSSSVMPLPLVFLDLNINFRGDDSSKLPT